MTLNRRKLLCFAGGSTCLAVIGAGCGNPTGSPPTGPVSAGNLSDLAVGSLLVMSNVVVARDENGVYGMSSVCTHAGCLLSDGSRTIANLSDEEFERYTLAARLAEEAVRGGSIVPVGDIAADTAVLFNGMLAVPRLAGHLPD